MQLDAEPTTAGTRLDLFLSSRIQDSSRARIQEWIRDGRVRIDGVVERRGSHKLRGGETVQVEPAERKPLLAEPEAMDLDIVYEDSHVAVVDKPAGISVHAGAGNRSGTLVNALLHHLSSLSGVSGASRPGIVHRLDRLTSGLLLVAKHDLAHRRLQQQFQRRVVDKQYWAVVEGVWPADPHADRRLLRFGRPVMRDGLWWLRLEMPVRRDKRNRIKMAVSRAGREAVSDVRHLRAASSYSLVAVRIHTGRTHQIRVHLASSGHPVVGDSLYGARRRTPEVPELKRFLLHSRRLEFEHPETGDRMGFEAPLPADFDGSLAPLGL